MDIANREDDTLGNVITGWRDENVAVWWLKVMDSSDNLPVWGIECPNNLNFMP